MDKYTNEDIPELIAILKGTKEDQSNTSGENLCRSCKYDKTWIKSGYHNCCKCKLQICHAPVYKEINDCTRCQFRKKISYERRNHYENKIKEWSQILIFI